jgi:ubiquinone/menaquinone biosynthesis C-methylase UbiE
MMADPDPCTEPSAEERDRKLVERYDAHAAVYQELWAPTLRLASVELIRKLAAYPVRRLIDVGAGVGALWSDLRKAFSDARLFGVDRSLGMLKLAAPASARIVADARALPVASASMDLALMIFMLFHLDDPGEGIREARRIVRPGGGLGIVTWGTTLSSTATLTWTECLDEHHAAPPDTSTLPRDELVNTPDKVERLLRSAGFETVRAWTADLVTEIGLEHLLRLKTTMGSEKVRFDSLDDGARADCLATARRRLQTLSPDDFKATATIVYAIGS